MLPLLEKCVRDDDEQSWHELWRLFNEAASSPICRVLLRSGVSRTDFDDIVMEVWVELLEQNKRRLLSFQGGSEIQLRTWLKHVAMNFTRNWVDKQMRAVRKQRQSLRSLSGTVYRNSLGHELSAWLEELVSQATNRDRGRLRILTGIDHPAHPPFRPNLPALAAALEGEV